MLTLIVGESTEGDSALGKCFEETEGGFMASPVADMDTVVLQGRGEGLLQQCRRETDLALAFGDDREACKIRVRIVGAMSCGLGLLQGTNPPGMIDVPESGERRRRYCRRAVGRNKNLRSFRVQPLDE